MIKNAVKKLFIVSGPSGAGKDTVINALFEKRSDIRFSISSITRAMRPGEKQGEKYNFISVDEFKSMIAENGFLEYAEYCGNFYGTPRAAVEQWLKNGETVLIEVDVQGAEKIMQIYPGANYVFIMPPSLGKLKQRLTMRKTDSAEVIKRRIEAAENEIKKAAKYDFVIINRENELERAAKEFCKIIDGERVADTPENKENIIEEVLKNA